MALATSASIRADQTSSIGYIRWMYGPAQKQPLRAWIPNRSLSTATTKFACSRPRGWRSPSETIGSRSASRCCRGSRSAGSAPRRERPAGEVALAPADLLGADRLLEREHEPGADRLDDRRRARPPRGPRGRGGSAWPRRADEEDRPAARHGRDAVAEQPPLGDEHARAFRGRRRTCAARGRPRPCSVASVRRGHVDRQVRAGRRVVPAGQRPVPVQQRRRRRRRRSRSR